MNTDPSQLHAWALWCTNAVQQVCWAVLFLIFNDFIMRALGNDYNKPDSLELRQTKYELLAIYKMQDDLSSQIIEACDVQIAALQKNPSQKNPSEPTQNTPNGFVHFEALPSFRSHDGRDTHKHLYRPQNFWFYGSGRPLDTGTVTETSPTVSASL